MEHGETLASARHYQALLSSCERTAEAAAIGEAYRLEPTQHEPPLD